MKLLYVVRGRSFTLGAAPVGEWPVAAYEFAEQAEAHASKLEEESYTYLHDQCMEDGDFNDRAAKEWPKISKYDSEESCLYEGGNEYWVEKVMLRQEVPL